MGSECSSCTRALEEQDNVWIFEDFGKPANQNNGRASQLNKARNDQSYFTLKEMINQHPENYQKIEVIKSHMLAYKDRKIYNAMKSKLKEKQTYFTSDELHETLSKTEGLKDKKIIIKTHVYESKATYTGEWLGGFRHGKGKMVWKDGVSYEGNWVFGFAEGEGELKYPNGDYAKGTYMYNKLNGKGEIHTTETGYTYTGNFEDDLQSGQGKETWADGTSYEGLYEMGKKEKFGHFKWRGGTFYIGEWKDNKIHGLGIYSWSDGRRFYGEWKNFKMNGFGFFTWRDGKKFIGEYKNDKKYNFGVWWDVNNNKYEGFWDKGMREGLGKFINADGSFKIGYWKNNNISEVFQDEKEIAAKLGEIDSHKEEINKKVEIVIQSIKLLFEKMAPNISLKILGIN